MLRRLKNDPDAFVMTVLPANGKVDIKRLEVYVDQAVTDDEESVFQAGRHMDSVKLRYQDLANLVHPKMAEFQQGPIKLPGEA